MLCREVFEFAVVARRHEGVVGVGDDRGLTSADGANVFAEVLGVESEGVV